MNIRPIIINYFGNSIFVSSDTKIAESMNITEKREKIMTQIKAESVGTVNSTVNAEITENPLQAAAFHLLHQIFDSGDETPINDLEVIADNL